MISACDPSDRLRAGGVGPSSLIQHSSRKMQLVLIPLQGGWRIQSSPKITKRKTIQATAKKAKRKICDESNVGANSETTKVLQHVSWQSAIEYLYISSVIKISLVSKYAVSSTVTAWDCFCPNKIKMVCSHTDSNVKSKNTKYNSYNTSHWDQPKEQALGSPELFLSGRMLQNKKEAGGEKKKLEAMTMKAFFPSIPVLNASRKVAFLFGSRLVTDQDANYYVKHSAYRW